MRRKTGGAATSHLLLGRRPESPGTDSAHSPAHYQFYCVGKDAVQSQGKAGSWKAKKLTVGGFCLGGTVTAS